MPQTHDFRPLRLFWHAQRYPDLAAWEMPCSMPMFFERATTHEVEEPYRVSHGFVIRFWPSRWAIVLGRWSKGWGAVGESIALTEAASARRMEVPLAQIKQWPGAAPEDTEGVFADTPGVVSWTDDQEAAS